MLHPSYTDLMKIVNEDSEGDTPVVNSRYSIVMATAKRARQIISNPYADEEDRQKPLSAAVKELNDRVIHILPEEEEEPGTEETAVEDGAAEESAVSEEETAEAGSEVTGEE